MCYWRNWLPRRRRTCKAEVVQRGPGRYYTSWVPRPSCLWPCRRKSAENIAWSCRGRNLHASRGDSRRFCRFPAWFLPRWAAAQTLCTRAPCTPCLCTCSTSWKETGRCSGSSGSTMTPFRTAFFSLIPRLLSPRLPPSQQGSSSCWTHRLARFVRWSNPVLSLRCLRRQGCSSRFPRFLYILFFFNLQKKIIW